MEEATSDPPAGIPILMYHEIAPRPESRSRLAVAPDAFSAQLSALHDGGYQTVTLAGLMTALNHGQGQLPARPVVLTFDDGYADFHTRAMPLLARHGFTATLFVTTGWVRDADSLPGRPPPGRMLSWSEVDEAASEGIEIAAHSHTHPQLDQLPPDRLRRDLTTGKAVLEDRLGYPVPGLAYPYGYSNTQVRKVANELGHRYACAVGNAMMTPQADPLALPRLTIRRSTSLPEFRQIVRGDHLDRVFFKDRALTRGWSVVRRGRAALGRRPSPQ